MRFLGPRPILTSIGAVGLLTGLAYGTSVFRDIVFAGLYGGSQLLDVYFTALGPSQFLGLELASLAYLAFLPEFSRALKTDGSVVTKRLLNERILLALQDVVCSSRCIC